MFPPTVACDAQSRNLAPVDASGSASAVGSSIDGSVEDYEDVEGPTDHHHFGGPYRHMYVDDPGQSDDPNFPNESTTNGGVSSSLRRQMEAVLLHTEVTLLVLSNLLAGVSLLLSKAEDVNWTGSHKQM